MDSITPILIDAGGGFIEVVRSPDQHKYLGVRFSGDLRKRGQAMLAGRIKCAWGKFHKFRKDLTNKHIDIKLRLKLFDSVVTPSALYGLTAAPLTAVQVERLAITQRKMLRLMVGYVKNPEDSWEDMYRRLRGKIDVAIRHFPIRMWGPELSASKSKVHGELCSDSRPELLKRVHEWDPASVLDQKLPVQPRRLRGHPMTTWAQQAS